MTERRKRLLRWVGYPLLGWLVFLFALHFTFPYERLRERLERELSREYDVAIAEVGPGLLPGRYTLHGLTVTTRPATETEKPKTITIDRVDLSIGLLAALGKTASVGFDASLGEGRLVGTVEYSAQKGLALDVETHDVSLQTIPGIAIVTGGAPIHGPVVLKVRLSVPQMKWALANGTVEVGCDDCTIGDGVTKVHAPGGGPPSAFMTEGFTLPKIRLGELEGKIQITDGLACIVRLASHSNEGDLSVEGGVKLVDPVKDSQAQLFARIKLSDEFKKQSARNNDFDILMGTGVRGADGTSQYQAKSPLATLVWRPAKVTPPPMRECAGVAQPAPPRAPAARPPGPLPAPAIPTPPPAAAPAVAPPPTPAPTPEPPPAAAPPVPEPTPPPPQPPGSPEASPPPPMGALPPPAPPPEAAPTPTPPAEPPPPAAP